MTTTADIPRIHIDRRHVMAEGRTRPSERIATTSDVYAINANDKTTPLPKWNGVERPWLANRSNESCIPAGIYTLIPHVSPKYGEVYAFVGGGVTERTHEVPQSAARWGCLIHPANYVHQLQGCLALGMSAGEKDGVPCVWSSRDALKSFKASFDYGLIIAVVRWV